MDYSLPSILLQQRQLQCQAHSSRRRNSRSMALHEHVWCGCQQSPLRDWMQLQCAELERQWRRVSTEACEHTPYSHTTSLRIGYDSMDEWVPCVCFGVKWRHEVMNERTNPTPKTSQSQKSNNGRVHNAQCCDRGQQSRLQSALNLSQITTISII